MNNNKDHLLKINTIEKHEEIEIYIIDNGIGIEKENLTKMKKPFFSTKEKGTGLGVYLSSEIIKAHEGKINYDSNKNGTTVVLKLPKE